MENGLTSTRKAKKLNNHFVLYCSVGLEIERKFLIKKDLWKPLKKETGRYLKQGYILNDPQKTIRVRVDGEKGYLTIKGITTGATRKEFEYPIPKVEAEELLNNFCSNTLSKIRYHLYHEGKLWEVDEFLEENEGLIVAEIELESEAEQFSIPDWVSEEVTSDSKYYNSNLSLKPFKSW